MKDIRLPQYANLYYQDAWGRRHEVPVSALTVVEHETDDLACSVAFSAGLDMNVTIRGGQARKVINMLRAASDDPKMDWTLIPVQL